MLINVYDTERFEGDVESWTFRMGELGVCLFSPVSQMGDRPAVGINLPQPTLLANRLIAGQVLRLLS